MLHILVITSLLHLCTADNCYTVNSGGTLTNGNSCSGDVIITDEVKIIGSRAFWRCTEKYGDGCKECNINTCLRCDDGEHIFNTTDNGTCHIIK